MTKPTSDVTETELSLLEQLWSRGESLVRDLAEALYGEAGRSELASVQKLLERLHAKGCVERRREGRAHAYRACVEREQLIARRLRDTADALCGGSFTPLLAQLVDTRRLSDEDLDELRQLVTDLEQRGKEPRS
ncbi:MAG: BlaI/MecI/CopY family transcriptional regulator [Acidobacteriota bacterium]